MKLKSAAYVTLIIGLLFIAADAQQNKSLKNSDIIRMTQKGLGENVIVKAIETSETDFDTSPDALIQLHDSKVGDKVIESMLQAQERKNKPNRSVLSNQSATEAKPEKGVSWKDMPVVKGKPIARPDTVVFGEKYPDSIYIGDDRVGWRTAQKYQKVSVKIGTQDHLNAGDYKVITIRDNEGVLETYTLKPNSLPIEVTLDISKSDVVGFVIHNFEGFLDPQYIRFIDVKFIPK
jgi:DNA-directed RNA polymerase subunit H (RpoH/RPB5)